MQKQFLTHSYVRCLAAQAVIPLKQPTSTVTEINGDFAMGFSWQRMFPKQSQKDLHL